MDGCNHPLVPCMPLPRGLLEAGEFTFLRSKCYAPTSIVHFFKSPKSLTLRYPAFQPRCVMTITGSLRHTRNYLCQQENDMRSQNLQYKFQEWLRHRKSPRKSAPSDF